MGRVAAILGHLASALIGLLLLVSAVAKAREPHETTQAFAWIFGVSLAPAGVVVLILVEAILGTVLVLGMSPVKARLSAGLMFLAFAAWGMTMWLGHAPVQCGCGLKFLPFFSRVDPIAVVVRGFFGFGLCLLAACAARHDLQGNTRQENDSEDRSVQEVV